MCRAKPSPVSLMNGLQKTILALKLVTTQSSVSHETCTMEVQSQGSPSDTYEQPFQLYWLKSVSKENDMKLCLPGELKNEGAEPRLLQWHRWTALSRLSCHLNYHINLKLCLLGEQPVALSPRRPEQWMCIAEASPLSPMNWYFNTILPPKPLYSLKAPSPRRMAQHFVSQKT